jgi:hypothetical protein
MTRGVLELHKPDIQVQMTNFMDEPVTIYTNEQIGTCESYYEQEAPHIGTCQNIQLGSGELLSKTLPSYLQDLFERSIVHLPSNDQEKLQELLTKYQDVFARSNDDLGQTDRVQHRKRADPSFFLRSTTGDDHGLFDGSITFLSNILSISAFSISRLPSGNLLGACRIGLAVPVFILC